MNKLHYLLLLALLTGCATSRKTTNSTPEQKQYTVILSMDAFRWDLARRSHTPTLDSLKRVGTYAEIQPVFPANTFPSHYSMATGLYPDHHGVVNNGFYDKVAGKYRSVFDSLDVHSLGFWGGEPIWNTAERQGKTANIFMWVGSEYLINDRRASVWTPYSSKHSFYKRADWVIDAMTRPEAEIPDLVMWYFEQPDAVMHRHGTTSKQVVAKTEHIDSVLHYFFREIRRSPVFNRTNFIITADHGMAELSPYRYINLMYLLDTTKVVRAIRGTPFGLEVKEEYIDEALRILRRTKHLKAWRREEMPERFHYGTHTTRLTNIIILPQTGWTLDYDVWGKKVRNRAAHGFDNRDRDMHMVFYASGPAFRKGYRQRTFENHNMYLILCRLLGIEPAQNDADSRKINRMFHKD